MTRRSAFTMVEMIVVISIILIVLSLVLPAAAALWAERKVSHAENVVEGFFMSTRAQAMREGRDIGFFSYVDDRGDQHFLSIAQVPPPDPSNTVQVEAYQNLFEFTDDRSATLLKPIRVVPRYVVDVPPEGAPPESPDYFDAGELSESDYLASDQDASPAQRHRNFFTVVFSPEGNLLSFRSVIMLDADLNKDGLGVQTGLPVTDESTASTEYVSFDGTSLPLSGQDPSFFIPGTIVLGPPEKTVALNFPSVDGLLVYDDQLFSELDLSGKQPFLLRVGRPIYVSRMVGAIIRGSIGESQR